MVVEELLQLFVCEINIQLFQAVVLQKQKKVLQKLIKLLLKQIFAANLYFYTNSRL